MSKKNISTLIAEATTKAYDGQLTSFGEAVDADLSTDAGRKAAIKQYNETCDYVRGMFTGETSEGKKFSGPELPYTETMYSSDSSVVFKRVIGEVLVKPKEPAAWLTNNVAQKITLDAKAPLHVTFPAINAFQAFDVAEGQEYRPQSLAFQENITSMRMKKIGVLASITEEIINASIYPLIALHLELMSKGILRRGEEHCFQALVQKGREVFNNDTAVVADRTSGVDSSQVFNATLALKDILKLQSSIIGAKYQPTDMLVHPLAYNIIFQDPILRGTLAHIGQMGSMLDWQQGPNFDQNRNMPFGLNYVPYYALPYDESGVMVNAPGSGFTAALLTDVYVIDRNNSMAMIERGGIEMEDWDDFFRDSKVLKGRKYMAVAGLDGGKAIAVARNVRVAENFQPLYTIRSVA